MSSTLNAPSPEQHRHQHQHDTLRNAAEQDEMNDTVMDLEPSPSIRRARNPHVPLRRGAHRGYSSLQVLPSYNSPGGVGNNDNDTNNNNDDDNDYDYDNDYDNNKSPLAGRVKIMPRQRLVSSPAVVSSSASSSRRSSSAAVLSSPLHRPNPRSFSTSTPAAAAAASIRNAPTSGLAMSAMANSDAEGPIGGATVDGKRKRTVSASDGFVDREAEEAERQRKERADLEKPKRSRFGLSLLPGMGLVQFVAGKVWDLCWGSNSGTKFNGFQAGGGSQYEVRETVAGEANKQAEDQETSKQECNTPQSKRSPDRPSNNFSPDIRSQWIVIQKDQPEISYRRPSSQQSSLMASPNSMKENISTPVSASPTSQKYPRRNTLATQLASPPKSARRPHVSMRKRHSNGASGARSQSASISSPHAANPLMNLSTNGGVVAGSHKAKASPRHSYSGSPSSGKSRTPRQERDRDSSFWRLEEQMRDMIREGKEALHKKVEIEYCDDPSSADNIGALESGKMEVDDNNAWV